MNSARTTKDNPSWVNVREISEKQHVILRLEIVQRAILEEPLKFETADQDPKLKHVQKEIQALQAALKQAIQKRAEKQYQLLEKAAEPLVSWQGEKDLEDIFLADQVSRNDLSTALKNKKNSYLEWVQLVEKLEETRERFLDKYLGYFKSQQDTILEQKIETQKNLKKTLPEMAKFREKAEEYTLVRTAIFRVTEQAMNALSSGLISFVVIVLFCSWKWQLWGALWGVVLGYLLFSNITHKFAFVTDEDVLGQYDFLIEKYELKKIKSFYRYEKHEHPDLPTSFDASRGEVLMKLLTKDINHYSGVFNSEERKREEFTNYLQYLDGRRQWLKEQIGKIELRQGLKEEGLFVAEDFEAPEQPKKKPSKKPRVRKSKSPGARNAGLADHLGLKEDEHDFDGDVSPPIPIPLPEDVISFDETPVKEKSGFALIPEVEDEPDFEEPFVLPETPRPAVKSKITVVRKISKDPKVKKTSKPKPQKPPEESGEVRAPVEDGPPVTPEEVVLPETPKEKRKFSLFSRQKKNKGSEP